MERGMKEQFVIGRPIEGIYLNGIEFLQNENGTVFFDSTEDAVEFVVETLGVDSADAQDYIFTKDFYDGKDCR
jgi:hypothetical protein